MITYSSWFFITEPVGNNRLDYARRTDPRIYVPSLLPGNIEDIAEAQTCALECDVDGVITAWYGLEHFVFLEDARVPTWIFDNHNHAYAFWHSAREQWYSIGPLPVVHIDQHTDLSIPLRFRDEWESVFDYTQNILTIADFIVPAMQEGLIMETHVITDESQEMSRCFTWEWEMLIRKQDSLPEKDFILDIDLDYFAQGFEEDLTLSLVWKLISRATIITIATSPLFIEQEKALSILKSLQKELLLL